MAKRVPAIIVLAGTNGAGKSSIIGEFIRVQGGAYYNPDEAARKLRLLSPALEQQAANGQAWALGKEQLQAAIASRSDYVFETTLGGRTIPVLLARAVQQQGYHLTIWYIGLDSVEAHVLRVRQRVQRGGHDIPENRIRERYTRSLENLIALAPYIHELRLLDNSRIVDIAAGEMPKPRALIHYKAGKIRQLAELHTMPQWARPVIAAMTNVKQ